MSRIELQSKGLIYALLLLSGLTLGSLAWPAASSAATDECKK